MDELYLRVFADRSELLYPDGRQEVFYEGLAGAETRQRYETITKTLAEGYLSKQIEFCRETPENVDTSSLTETHMHFIRVLVDSLTSEIGRALIALTIMQLTIKAIEPKQSIRLHKGGKSRRDFSWQAGISMRFLDKKYITPTLRRYNLLFINADGIMMTRSLAENYPYTLVYKAQLRGAKQEWLLIVEEIENNRLPCEAALHYLISLLLNKQQQFLQLVDATLHATKVYESLLAIHAAPFIRQLIFALIEQSEYAPRVMEIAMHSFLQAVLELVPSAGELQTLSQMRSANKKHGNIGDIEVLKDGEIIEAWDAKFGKPYLRDELEELTEKIKNHADVEMVGFVTNETPQRLDELQPRREEIEATYGVTVQILTLDEWIDYQSRLVFEQGITMDIVFKNWLIALVETLGQKRRLIAPIDEPSYAWLVKLKSLLEQQISSLSAN